MDINKLYAIFKASGGVNTDTRTIAPGQLFVALKGENFDGNNFALQALEAGACCAVVNDTVASDAPGLFKVPDTLQALQELAAYHRKQLDIPVIGLTGTNGKTTTKELIREVLSKKYKVAATAGNLNNDIGVPLTVLGLGRDTELAVVEMGASHPEDLKPLLAVAQPTHGLITNVGKAHILGFGSFEGVKAAKGALYDFISSVGGTIFMNADDAVLAEMASERPNLSIVPYGVNYWDTIVLPSDAKHPFMRIAIPEDIGCDAASENLPVLETRLVGAYNATNALAAIAVGLHFGVSLEEAMDAIAAYEPANKRSQMVHTEVNTLIVDAYNANPSSMAVALESFASVQAARKAVMLGQMGELGVISLDSHMEVLSAVKDLPEVYLTGGEFARAIKEVYGREPSEGVAVKPGLLWFTSSTALAGYIKQHPVKGAVILIKGSRSQEMEKVIPEL